MSSEKKYLTLEEMHQVNFELLSEFADMCDRYRLRYDLCGGSLLGAVRHQGFIPWDDDVDVVMPRPDYERMLNMYLNHMIELPAKRAIISNRDCTFPRHYARLIREDVCRDAKYASQDDCPYIGIDIFTVDGLPEDDQQLKKQYAKRARLRRLLLLSTSKPGQSSRGKKIAVIKDILRPFLCLYGPYKIARKLESECNKVPYEDAKYVGVSNGMYGVKERWLKSDMLPQRKFKFETGEFNGYKNYDIYLSNLYGDYMKLPPKEAQIPHDFKAYWNDNKLL